MPRLTQEQFDTMKARGLSDDSITNLAKQKGFDLPDKRGVGQKILDGASKVSNFFGAKGITDQFGASMARVALPDEQEKFVSNPSLKDVVGNAVQSGANLIPGAGVGAKLGAKVLIGAGTGLAMDVGSKLQNNLSPTPGVGTAVGAALPIGGAIVRPAVGILNRLFKGLGSSLSGVSTKNIDAIT